MSHPNDGDDVPLQLTAVMLGVQDLERARKFYVDGLGCSVDNEYETFISLDLGDGSSPIALYPWETAARDAGVSPEGSGFRGVSFHHIVSSNEEVDAVFARAERAGATAVKAAEVMPSGGYSGYFADPDGYLWKIAAS